ncbi:4-hydroxyphenylpyruvate dioxygenase [Variovorax sp.]|jgi:4-hydroxyphenylpyruvate dioxygenase|uniref:4-hydroxyphenylpyruvate dioxygenase n=1 Tax=Variovorax sp. TaxID=1871043 RepID=UPI00121CE47C|nr:4-hydroxyphenylpyruvate dioxygenase [Variovorax sp.]TAJ64844.1 MAG: 4-hydroxyphenylpyruvate dioxygenase [Variovorax sp.]
MTQKERAEVLGTAFMEFASPDPQALAAVLERMGFRTVARHRAGHALLMRQAGVEFIVGTRQDGHAMRFAAHHGPSCAGMAFRVADSARAMTLARERGAQPLDAAATSLLPDCALQGIGGSALYLVDDAALAALHAQFEFDPAAVPDTGADFAPFVRVDHVTHCVHPGNMPQWVDFYKNIFGFEEVFKFVAGDASNGFDTIAVRDPASTACVTVVSPMGRSSQIQEFIDEYNGEGIQHIALFSDDLYTSVERLRGAGVEFLPTPAAYYDALDTRLPGHGEDVARMKSLGMLLDGAATGENPDARARFLLQIFTRKMIGPIFFEAIQRKGDTSFGEGNAKALFEAIKREQAGADAH